VLLKILNNNTINIIYKWILRFYYLRVLIIGIVLLCFSLTLFFSNYKISVNHGLNLFLMVICGILGLSLFIIGLIKKSETEFGVKNKWHEEDIE